MDFKEMKDMIIDMQEKNYDTFVKALISVEKGIEDEKVLDDLYNRYMDEDTMGLLDENFDYVIDEMRDEGIAVESVERKEQQEELTNITGNIVKDVDVKHIKTVNGNEFDVANFSICTNDENGGRKYHDISAYGEKANDVKNWKQGDFVKIFGQVRHSYGDEGKEYTNIKVLSSRMLKEKAQMKERPKAKESTLGKLNKYKETVANTDKKPQEKEKAIKNDREV